MDRGPQDLQFYPRTVQGGLSWEEGLPRSGAPSRHRGEAPPPGSWEAVLWTSGSWASPGPVGTPCPGFALRFRHWESECFVPGFWAPSGDRISVVESGVEGQGGLRRVGRVFSPERGQEGWSGQGDRRVPWTCL